MTASPSSFDGARPREALTLARNVASRYLAVTTETVIGLLMLPFNVAHLGPAGYGLWMLTASVTTYFAILDLGYAGSVVRFVAHYRARRDIRALNEILSTIFFVFLGLGLAAYVAGAAATLFLDRLFTLNTEEFATGRVVLMILSLNVAAGIAFTVFGGVVNGFQRYDLNNVAGTVSSIATALVNVVVLSLGYGLIALVAATTAVRLVTYLVYRWNAYRVFPDLQLSWALVRRDRLRELTGFSVYMSISDWAAKLNFSVDALVVGAFMGPAAVAVWSVAQRITDAVMRLTNQLNDVIFPNIVDHAASARTERLQLFLIETTRLSLAAAVPVSIGVAVMAGPIIQAWVGSDFVESVLILQLLMVTVLLRVSSSTAVTLLRGSGGHRLVAYVNASAALANLGISVLLIPVFRYAGVAIGTIVPVAIAGLCVVFPTACRRVGLPVRTGVLRAIVPPLWPGLVMGAGLVAARSYAGSSLVALGAALVAGALGYGLLFVFVALGAEDRQRYTARLLGMRWRSGLQPVSEGA